LLVSTPASRTNTNNGQDFAPRWSSSPTRDLMHQIVGVSGANTSNRQGLGTSLVFFTNARNEA
jgi:hypothetical protein